ncbi:MAG: hypothetical protein HQK77_03755 [Desulfobacterales bacterium]|nr:hypothetical protein [Desulfobacterales bacterium]
MNWIRAVLLIFLLVPKLSIAEIIPKIIVVNSNASVEKYKIVQDEFVKLIPYPLLSYDIADKSLEEIDIKLESDQTKADIIYCIGIKAYLFANKTFNAKSILFSSIINWLRLELPQNTYGISSELHSGMQISLFRYFFPQIKKIGVLYTKNYTRQWLTDTEAIGKEMNIEIISQDGTESMDIKKLLAVVQAYWLIPDPFIMSEKKNIFMLLRQCDEEKIPVFTYNAAFAKCGAVLAVELDNPTIGRQAADITKTLLSNQPIEDKVQYLAGSYIVLNLTKVKEYKIPFQEIALETTNLILE